MSLIVAARFQTFDQAELAARSLFAHGFSEDDVHTFYVNTAGEHDRYPLGGDRVADPDSQGAQWGAVIGAACIGLVFAVVCGAVAWRISGSGPAIIAAAGVGAYIGSLWGALWVVGRHSRRRINAPSPIDAPPEVRPAGVLLALHITRDREDEACGLLRDAGGKQIERAHGRWQGGKWQDFDPLEPPNS